MKLLWILIISIIIMSLARIFLSRKDATSSTVSAEQVYNEAARQIYELLFCDDVHKYEGLKTHFPVLFAPNPSQEDVLSLAQNPGTESRVRILAHRRLKEEGFSAPERAVLGVVVEYNQKGKGLDTLAVFADGSIRYINYTGKMAVVDSPRPTTKIPVLTKQIFEQARQLANAIGPWEERRLPPPAAEQVRITLLVNGDIYFGQAPASVMWKDPLGAPLLQSMTALLVEVTQESAEEATIPAEVKLL